MQVVVRGVWSSYEYHENELKGSNIYACGGWFNNEWWYKRSCNIKSYIHMYW